ncbi:MAG TPA: 3-methyl-2-oxobutanoate dehydrogenase subunit VorB [Synergistales bacterium]|nr:3-methyl-2-oxobutanoate dehydrogenase subunit VorB [Synergistaceae bacterium]MDD3917049.1 3-methyl-2-oxobutanoate dehydrogenase subunit VorB [Synergistaceae bacterium]NLD97970.1 3-methyl-2-oxobutanoate dehydrogenase subunit VorB [Synergistaceae bacterium]HPE64616.1 3-methyl-2-oxobutanoate dehydrogenase subunit VorB [Synergistales bacterium]HRV97313.1 3-methyl-2-oxobutanoate dehydrogenase subunit VorB [Aminobacteriaceae bacterium]
MGRVLMKGTEAIAEAAIQAGCKYFFGYPITPQNEIPEYMSAHLPEVGGVYVQAESEVASINMVLGGGATGYRVMTSSSSPGISLMSEGISYVAGCEIPAVIVNVMRAGPGLGGILPGQADYLQSTKGGGNGDYNLIVLAPSTLQECVDLTQLAFDLAQKYRNPVMVAADGFMGQMMEAVEIKPSPSKDQPADPSWALGFMGERGGKRSHLHSLFLSPEPLEEHNRKLQKKYQAMKDAEQRCECYMMDDAEVLIAAYGTTARISRSAVNNLRAEGLKVGMIRPITLWPYPYEAFKKLPSTVKHILVSEMNAGQMVDDVKVATGCKYPVSFYGRMGGFAPSVGEIENECRRILGL